MRWITSPHWLFENLDCSRKIPISITSTWLAGRNRCYRVVMIHGKGPIRQRFPKDYYKEKGKLLKEFPSFLVRKMTSCGNFRTILLTPYLTLWIRGVNISLFLRCNNFQKWCDAHAVKTLCTCSWGMVLMMHVRMTRLPVWRVSDCKGDQGKEGIWVASRFLTAKIPSALLVAVGWLQHTRYPRFRRGTFGYGITTSPTREVEYEHGVFMRVHVSIPMLPKCICYAVHAQRQHLI
jgi:hypothetical protein